MTSSASPAGTPSRASRWACSRAPCGIGIAGVVDRPLVALLSAAPAVALTIWMLPRGDLYSGYDLGPGGFVALAIAVLTVAVSVRRLVRR